MRTQRLQALLTLAILLLTSVGGRLNAEQGDLQILRIDPDTSRVTIHVGKAGLFRFAGHTHEVIAPAVSGEVHFSPDDPTRSSVYLEIDAASLRVTGRGEPAEDVPEVQRVMLSDRVLDVARFPTIIFESRKLGLVEAGAHALVVMIAGDLTLHGVTRPQIVKVAVEIQPDGVIAQGELEIKQTDFGIKPVGAAGGRPPCTRWSSVPRLSLKRRPTETALRRPQRERRERPLQAAQREHRPRVADTGDRVELLAQEALV